jgi:predicted nicotinamide N-methyase
VDASRLQTAQLSFVMGQDQGVTDVHGRRLHDLADRAAATGAAGLDSLRLVRVPLAPEVQLYLATDAIVLAARMETMAGTTLAAPFWASAWLGGQALARFLLDHPGVVAGRRVLDFASGSGLVGIAASLAGAAAVTANDIDPHAIAAIELNAQANHVEIAVNGRNLLDGDGDGDGDADVVLAGDVFYSQSMAMAVLSFLDRAAARGAQVFIGDPGRRDLPLDRLQIVATYGTAGAATQSDAEIDEVHVMQLKSG